MKLYLLAVLSSALLVSGYKSYDGYQVFQVVPNSWQALDAIASSLPNPSLKVDFWKEPSKVGKAMDIMVSPDQKNDLVEFLNKLDVTAKVVIENVQTLIDEERRTINQRSGAVFQLDQYHSYNEISAWLDTMVKTYPALATTFSIGNSTEGREMKVMKLGAAGKNKKGFWLDAGIHAREWITPATAVWIINELLTKYSSNNEYKSFLDNIDFYILPSANPDGYNYSWTKERLWRKTRSGPRCTSNWFGKQCCYGADPNRNWDYHWMESGASNNPCDDTYAGPNAFSEPETKAMSDWLWGKRASLQSYISLHSYSQLWMYSYGNKPGNYPPDVAQLRAAGLQGAAALRSLYGTTYQVGTPADILYDASGASMDWAKGVAQIKWTYTLELRPTNGNIYGFQLPAAQILPTAQETWNGLMVIVREVMNM